MEGKAKKQQKGKAKKQQKVCPPSWKNDFNNVVSIDNISDTDDISDRRHKYSK